MSAPCVVVGCGKMASGQHWVGYPPAYCPEHRREMLGDLAPEEQPDRHSIHLWQQDDVQAAATMLERGCCEG